MKGKMKALLVTLNILRVFLIVLAFIVLGVGAIYYGLVPNERLLNQSASVGLGLIVLSVGVFIVQESVI